MNCIAFRRELSSSAASWNEDLRSHRRECPACDAFARRQAAFEATLAEAVRIDVPEGLASRVRLAHGIREKQARRRRLRLAAFAAVASCGLALVASWLARSPVRLDEDVVAHIESEPSHLWARGELSRAEVEVALAPLGIRVEDELSPIRYAGTCRIRRRAGAHIVLQGERGPVTVLYLPEEPLNQRLPVRHDRLQGTIVPAGRGGLAIVGERGEDLHVVEQRLRRALRFDSGKVARSAGGSHV